MHKALWIIGGIVLGILLYVLPDMAANLGESMSFRLKSTVAVFLLLGSIAMEYKKRHTAGTFMLAAGIALGLLIAFGGYIRTAELGA